MNTERIDLTIDTSVRNPLNVELNIQDMSFRANGRDYSRSRIHDTLTSTGRKDTLGRTIYISNGVEFVINAKHGSVSTTAFCAIELPETIVFKDIDGARKCTYQARRHSAYAWLK